jgi:benzoyl-CoA reductase/2-hydroxyglutaryl-CoA dehydratase subunit BcrC/BadD/HgdB
MYYTEILKLCGFEDAEIERARPRIDKAFKKLEIGPEDCQRAEDRIRKYFSIELLGVRRCLGIWLKDLIDLVLSKEEGKKVVYTGVPPPAGLALSLVLAGVWCGVLDYTLGLTMGLIFDKLNPLLEAAEEHGTPPETASCSFHQARLGAIIKGIVPPPDAVLSPGFFCDQSAKVWDLIQALYGSPIMYLDSCMDSPWDEWPEIPHRRVRLYAADMREAKEELERVLGIEISEEILMAGWRNFMELRLSVQRMIELAKLEPKPISQVDLNPFWRLVSVPGKGALEEGKEVIGILTREIEKRVEEGKGVMPKGTPRVGLYAVAVSDPAVTRMLEESGLNLLGPLAYYLPPLQRMESKYTTPEEQSVEGSLRRGVFHSTSAFLIETIEGCRTLDLDGFLWFSQKACRASMPQMLIYKKGMEEELGIPVLVLEADLFDTRSYSAESLRTRVETFADLLRERKAAKRA